MGSTQEQYTSSHLQLLHAVSYVRADAAEVLRAALVLLKGV